MYYHCTNINNTNTTLTTLTSENPQGYYCIFRKNTRSYTDMDILFEVSEWVDILKKILKKEPTYEICEIRVSTRAEKFLMKTGYKRGTSKGYIIINELFRKSHNNPDIFHSTIAHEVIHTFPGAFNHGEIFKSYGRTLMKYCPNITISRLISDSGYTMALQKKREASDTHIKKWLIECTFCGQKIYRERNSKIIQHPEDFRCGLCNHPFSVRKIG